MAYPNATIEEGPFGSFLAGEAISLYRRCKFGAGSSPDGKVSLFQAGPTEVADCVAMQPLALGARGTVRFLNAGGEQYGWASGSIPAGSLVYGALSGKLSVDSTAGLFAGRATSAGYDGGPFTYVSVLTSAAGVFEMLSLTASPGINFTNQSNKAGAATGLLTNAPHAGPPDFWIPFTKDGVGMAWPAWFT